MSLCDGYKSNHGENGLLGVTTEGHGVYHRPATRKDSERVVLLDVSGTTVEEHKLTRNDSGIRSAIEYVTENYQWAELTETAEEYVSDPSSLTVSPEASPE